VRGGCGEGWGGGGGGGGVGLRGGGWGGGGVGGCPRLGGRGWLVGGGLQKQKTSFFLLLSHFTSVNCPHHAGDIAASVNPRKIIEAGDGRRSR